ncbi:hypothetical protein RYX36_012285 [Vicia faba]
MVNPCYCLNRKLFNVSQIQNDNNQWQGAIATWYGPPNGAGSDSGACGYTNSVEKPPLSKMISAGGPSLFLRGVECGSCYEDHTTLAFLLEIITKLNLDLWFETLLKIFTLQVL